MRYSDKRSAVNPDPIFVDSKSPAFPQILSPVGAAFSRDSTFKLTIVFGPRPLPASGQVLEVHELDYR